MGSTAGSSCLSSILAATFLILLLLSTATATAVENHHHHGHKRGVISPFCRTATTPKDKAICTGLVKDGKTWAEAMTNAIKAVIEIAMASKATVVDRVREKLPPVLKPVTKESIARGCKDAFDTYVFNLEQCIGFVNNDPYSSLEVYLSGTTFFDCKDGFDEFQISNPEVNHFYDTTVKFADILLSIYQNKPTIN